MTIINHSPLTAANFFLMDKDGAEVMLLVIKGTWRIGNGGQLFLADEQMPILSMPVYRGQPGRSSLIYDSDVILDKPGTDCVLIGHARALHARAAFVDEQVMVEGASTQGRLMFELPGTMPQVTARRWGYQGGLPVHLDTVIVEPDQERVTLTWRGVWDVHGYIHQIHSVRVEA